MLPIQLAYRWHANRTVSVKIRIKPNEVPYHFSYVQYVDIIVYGFCSRHNTIAVQVYKIKVPYQMSICSLLQHISNFWDRYYCFHIVGALRIMKMKMITVMMITFVMILIMLVRIMIIIMIIIVLIATIIIVFFAVIINMDVISIIIYIIVIVIIAIVIMISTLTV